RMHLAQRRLQSADPGPIQLAEPRIAEPVLPARSGAILLPQQRQRHVGPAQLAMNRRPVRHRPLLRQAFTTPVLIPRLRPIARWLSPWAKRSRRTSRIFRIDSLSPGIPFPPPFGKRSGLPMVEDRRQRRLATTRRPALMSTRTGVHDPPDSAFTINWIGCSRSNGISVHNPPERAICGQPTARG